MSKTHFAHRHYMDENSRSIGAGFLGAQTTNNFLPSRLFSFASINSLNVLGRGGMEQSVGQILLPSAVRVSAKLHDFELKAPETTYRVEIKKQANDQWFDICKYHALSESDQNIIMLFVNHVDGKVDLIWALPLGRFLKILLSDPTLPRFGWLPEAIEMAAKLKSKCPELQFKAKLRTRSFFASYKNKVQVIYERNWYIDLSFASASHARTGPVDGGAPQPNGTRCEQQEKLSAALIRWQEDNLWSFTWISGIG